MFRANYEQLVARVRCITMLSFLIVIMITIYPNESFAKEKIRQCIKGNIIHPDVSPEFVVVNFIELADLGKDASREDGERYSLFWALTEYETVPDSSQSLIIKSYKIDGMNYFSSKEVIVRLKLDVRAIRLVGCAPNGNDLAHSYLKKQLNDCNWRNRIVNIYDSNIRTFTRFNLSDSNRFINYVFGRDEVAKEIVAKKPSIYLVPKNKRIWVFEVRVIKKKGRWLISNDSIPLEMSYIDNEIEIYSEMIETWKKRKDICDGKLSNDNTFDLEKNKDERCRINLDRLKNTNQTIELLKSSLENKL
jgi:hypothetical protein